MNHLQLALIIATILVFVAGLAFRQVLAGVLVLIGAAVLSFGTVSFVNSILHSGSPGIVLSYALLVSMGAVGAILLGSGLIVLELGALRRRDL